MNLPARIEAKIAVRGDCWEWTAYTDPKGYGHVWDGETVGKAHRVVYEILVGPIPDGLELDHLCRNTGCVRPDHLEPVTPIENARRTRVAEYVARGVECKRGHD